MYIIRFFKSLFVKKPTTTFPYTVKGFASARKWAETQPHPYLTQLSLWDYACAQGYSDSEIKLHVINMYLKEKLEIENRDNMLSI